MLWSVWDYINCARLKSIQRYGFNNRKTNHACLFVSPYGIFLVSALIYEVTAAVILLLHTNMGDHAIHRIPRAVVVFSGKRKSGKDYITDLIQERLGKDTCSILRLSGPLKCQYAKEHGLDLDKLLDATSYKETYRADMIYWGEEKRNQDPGYFCRLISNGPGSDRPVWLISDARRMTDVAYFANHYHDQLIKVRVHAEEDTRKQRGWLFTEGVDDAESECGLDSGITWDYKIQNNGNSDELAMALNNLLTDIQRLQEGECKQPS